MAGMPSFLEPIADRNGKITPTWRAWFQSLGGAAPASSTFTDPITLTSGQIAFPATQVPSAGANTLDDYEEGTFTPTIAFGGNAVGVSYGVQTGTYTKIGNFVFFQITLSISNKGSSTGDVTVGTLPFTPAVDVALYARASNYTVGAGLVPVYDTNGTSIRLRTFNPTTGNIAASQETQVDSDFAILLAGSFRV